MDISEEVKQLLLQVATQLVFEQKEAAKEKLQMLTKGRKAKLKDLVSEDNVLDALKLLRLEFPNENEVILLKRRFVQLKGKEYLQVLPFQEVCMMYNQISHSVLELIDSLYN